MRRRPCRGAPGTPDTPLGGGSDAAGASDAVGVCRAYRLMYRGMLDQDVVLLDTLLDDHYVLTHMTGRSQTKQEWLGDVASGAMRYHNTRERSVEADVRGDGAVLVGRSRVEATIWGHRGTWNLQLTTNYTARCGTWIALDTTASTY